MAELKVHNWHVMWEFKNNKNVSESAKKICCQGLITDYQVQNKFSKFHSGNKSLRDKLRPEN